jgi:saxitoxin biosynthesis operon SxtJ-like protein
MARALWRIWLVLVRKVGYLQSQLILTLVYFVVIAPFALAVRLFSDPLGLRRAPVGHWLPADRASTPDLGSVRQQF